MDETIKTARRTFSKLGHSKTSTKGAIKYTTDHLPLAVWYMLRQMVTLFDRRFLLTSAIVAVMTALPFYAMNVFNLFNRLEDFAYGLGYIIVALSTLALKNTFYLRQIMVTSMVSLWALRLSTFLVLRGLTFRDFRVESFQRSLVAKSTFWFYQTLEIWLNSLPMVLLNSFGHNPSIGLTDIVGYALWITGFAMETIADYQKYTFKQLNKDRWCNVGLFQYRRHPNYFGDILAWFGIFLCVAPALHGWTWISVLAPIFHAFVLMFVTGIPPLERKSNERWGNNVEYQRYKESVPILIPAAPHTHVHRIIKKVE